MGTKPSEFYSRKRMLLKSLLAIISISVSAYLVHISFVSLSDTKEVIRNDTAYVFLFNVCTQSYIMLYYLVIGNSSSTYF